MEAFLVSTGLVALAEMGDKTQLLSLVLAARFKRPLPIILGILVATLANHAMAAGIGGWLASLLSADTLRWLLAGSFIAMGLWLLVPDKLDACDASEPRFGIFAATVVAFFLAEMGDKTQVATVALAAQYASLTAVVAGTTLGMLLANAPVVLAGERITRRIPIKLVHAIAALLFVGLGIGVLLQAAG